jgi:DNA polymerase (family 10)
MAKGGAIPASVAGAVARKLIEALRPASDRIAIVGSLRRKKHTVHDVDIVILPRDSGETGSEGRAEIEHVLASLVARGSLTPLRGGDKVKSFIATKTNVPIDLYIAAPHTWATLILIRTGSKNHNVKLAQRARDLGLKLKASGEGIEGPDGQMIRVRDERAIFAALKVPYIPPERRD